MRTPRLLQVSLLLLCTVTEAAALVGCSWYDWGTSTEANYGALDLRLELDRRGVPVGKTVHAWFTIRNSRLEPVVIDSPNKPVMDLEILDGVSHATLVSWSALNPTMIKNRLEWKPGESKMIELEWTATELQASRNVFIAGELYRSDSVIKSASALVSVFWDRNQ